MKFIRWRTIIVSLGIGAALYGGQSRNWFAMAQAPTPSSSAASAKESATNELQRSVAIYNYKTTAPSGPLRGEEIYYIKCWMCHNKHTIKAGTPAPLLKDLYKRPRLLTGKPVTDETVAEKIKAGGPAMPAYRHALSDQDMADLLSYLRDGKCCFEGDEPPRNPWYRYY